MKELSESVEANEREQRRERHETEPLLCFWLLASSSPAACLRSASIHSRFTLERRTPRAVVPPRFPLVSRSFPAPFPLLSRSRAPPPPSYRPFQLTDQSGYVNVSFDIKHALFAIINRQTCYPAMPARPLVIGSLIEFFSPEESVIEGEPSKPLDARKQPFFVASWHQREFQARSLHRRVVSDFRTRIDIRGPSINKRGPPWRNKKETSQLSR